ncbi:MAG TPA: hypothetical protein VF885_01705 [Arthrobacter sp.]
MQAEHLVLAPGSLISVQLLAIERIRRQARILSRPWSVPRYRAATAAWRAVEHAAVSLVLANALDPADYPDLDFTRSVDGHRPWMPAALDLIAAERESLVQEPGPSAVLDLICLDAAMAAIWQLIESQSD